MTTATARIAGALDRPTGNGAASSSPSAATVTANRKPFWKRVLAPIASLRVTVALLAMSMVVIFAGTSAQKELGLIEVLHRFFYSGYVWIPTKYLFPLWSWGWEHLSGSFPFPGGYTLIVALLVNVLAAHAVRFKMTWKRSGIFLIHFSLILLLVGELVSSAFKTEGLLPFRAGETRRFILDADKFELAVIEGKNADTDRVVAIPDGVLSRDSGTSNPIAHDDLPFSFTVDRYHVNADILGPKQEDPNAERLATAGVTGLGVVGVQKVAGIEMGTQNWPATFVTLRAGGQALGTYLVSPRLEAQTVQVAGRTFTLDLRPKRTYLPFSLELLEARHDKHLGTNDPRNYSSRVRLVDAEAGVSRDVLIKMNEPLRYGGRTIFQTGMDLPISTLTVVRNPVWTLPYLACLLGAIGLLVHFGIVLVNFLRKRAQTGQLFGFSSAAAPAPIAAPSAGTRAERRRAERELVQSGGSTGGIAAIVLPAIAVLLGVVYVVMHAAKKPPIPASGFDLITFGKIPVLFDGRVLPLDTVGRSGLKIVSGRESIKPEDGPRISAIQWLADVMANTPAGDDYKVFRIDHPQIKDLLGLSGEPLPTDRPREKGKVYENDKLFSYAQIMLGNPKNVEALQKQVDEAAKVPDKRRDLYQRKVLDLAGQLRVQMKLSQVGAILNLYDIRTDPKRSEQMFAALEETEGVAFEKMNPEQRAAFVAFGRIRQQIGRLQAMQSDEALRTEDLYFVPPLEKDGKAWRGLGQALAPTLEQQPGQVPLHEDASAFLDVIRDYRDGKVAAFNADVVGYASRAASQHPRTSANTAYEAFFNRFDPFTSSIVFYIAAFIFVIASWLTWQKPLWRTAVSLLVLAFVVHTLGLVMRIQISGRPPVTSLYTAAVFIGWGVVLLALGLEAVFRNGLGVATSAGVGFVTLLLAGGLASMEGDTMKPLQAVLDTNFWLATHVVCITLGYAATFLAGALAIAYVIGGLFTKAMENQETRKSLVRMTYGILCFAILFSFVGTILGGIWADQSWGRFWGWDPKENGAILLVLWVALVLHARWGGVAKERGVMSLSIIGNVVTAWSFFGTNMMGVGLHSYGFMESGVFWLSMFVYSQLVIFGLSLLPPALWRSSFGGGGAESTPRVAVA